MAAQRRGRRKTPDGLKIGQLAREAGVSAHTLRFYERRGLLPRPSRTTKNYRVYSPAALGTLEFIRRAQELDFTLGEVKELLDRRAKLARKPCPVREMVRNKMTTLRDELDRLQAAFERLAHLHDLNCEKRSGARCAILAALEDAGG